MVTDCTFCDIAAGKLAAHVVLADDVVVGFLDARPVFKGHVLVVPRQHYVTLADLPAELIAPYFKAVQLVSARLPVALGARGSFVGINNIVSQSVPHLHTHVVPRTKGDGLRGFFWPRHKYQSDDEAAQYASKIRAALDGSTPDTNTVDTNTVDTNTVDTNTSVPPYAELAILRQRRNVNSVIPGYAGSHG